MDRLQASSVNFMNLNERHSSEEFLVQNDVKIVIKIQTSLLFAEVLNFFLDFDDWSLSVLLDASTRPNITEN